jgi:hypothetical protein
MRNFGDTYRVVYLSSSTAYSIWLGQLDVCCCFAVQLRKSHSPKHPLHKGVTTKG